MKILGLSFGRNDGACTMFVKEALAGAEEEGAEISFIPTADLDIKRCRGCGACSSGMRAGKQIKCIIKDDYHYVENAVLDADAIIVAAPVYVLAPTGQFKNFVDRFGPAHDRAALEHEAAKRKAEGGEPLDPRVFKQRYVGYISVGGAKTENWVSLGIPTMQLFGFPTLMKAVDQINIHGFSGEDNPRKPMFLERSRKLGHNVARAVGKKPEEIEWMGDDEGICPVCHCNLLTVRKSTTVECPICGIYGKISIENDEVKVVFSPEEQKRSRLAIKGLEEHFAEINSFRRARNDVS